jgi:4-amino-4-deoxy-L-arabinose transferase-like glycosyltransferase
LLPHNFYSNLPQLTEMLYLLGLVTRSDIAAKLLHWCFGWLTAVAVYSIAARLWSRRVGVTAAALFYCEPFVQDLSQTARIDLATTFLATLAFGTLVTGLQETEDDRGLWLSALLAGGAVATKWIAIPVVLLPAGVFVLISRRSLWSTTTYCVLAIAAVVPWLAKNWLLAGNPVYPLLNNIFHSPHWTNEQAARFAQKHFATFGIEGLTQLGKLIWRYSFTEPFAVPLLLMVAPLLLLVRNAAPLVRRTAWLFILSYVGWFLLTYRPWRFLFPAFPLAALAGAYALEVVTKQKWLRLAVQTSIVVVMIIGLAEEMSVTLVDDESYHHVPPQMNFVEYALGQVGPGEFVERMGGGIYEPILWMNRHLPTTAKILYVGEARVYYARHPIVWSTAFDQHPLTAMLDKVENAAGLLDHMRQLGITHVYLNSSELTRLTKGYGYLAEINAQIVHDLLSNYAMPIHQRGGCTVYALKEPA